MMGALRSPPSTYVDPKAEVRLRLGVAPTFSRAAAVACAALFAAAPLLWLVLGEAWLGVASALAGAGVLGFALARRARAPSAWVSAHGWGLSRTDTLGSVRLAAWTEPFGLTLLANPARTRALLAITTQHHTRFVGVRLDSPAMHALLNEAATVADGGALAAHASEESSLSGEDAVMLVGMVRRHCPQALKRLFLSGSRGERIVLDGADLRIESALDAAHVGRTFDLARPLEWRGFMFHESMGAVAIVYQATWIRQGSTELVLVAPMPAELATGRGDASATDHDRRALLRDLRLMQSAPGEPPPRELRAAIERVFMLPLRQALDRAPRAARSAPPTRISSPDHAT